MFYAPLAPADKIGKRPTNIPRAICAGALAFVMLLGIGVVPAAAVPTEPDSTATAPAPASPTPKAEPTEDSNAAQTPSTSPVPEQEQPTGSENLQGGAGAFMGQGMTKQSLGIAPEVATPMSTLIQDSAKAALSQPATPFANPSGVQGQDVSGWQADPATHSISQVNWSQQWVMGSRFAYVKATEGNQFIDRSYSSHTRGARGVGMLTGAYHFALPLQSSAVSQADHFINNGGRWTNDGMTMPSLLDIENNPYSDPTKTPYYGNNCYNMSQADMVTWIKDFSNRVQAQTGRLPMIYTNYYWWQDCTGNSKAFSNQPLHIAAYGASSPWIPGGWSSYDFWQYSSTGPFDGDSNVWNGSLTALKTFASAGLPATPPSIPSSADVVAADATGTLWNYPATGTGGFKDRAKIGVGWLNIRSINVIDWNADGVLDIVAQWKNGTVSLYRGLPTGGFMSPLQLATDMADHQLVIGFWLASSPYPQILSRSKTGALQLWTNSAGAAINPGAQIGQGWSGLNLTMVDFNGDGKQDILAINAAGDMRLYRSDGLGQFVDEPRPVVSQGWQSTSSITVSSGFLAGNSVGLVTRERDGTLKYVPVPGNSTFGGRSVIGFGWNSFLIAGGDDISQGSAPTDPPAPDKPAPTPSIKAVSDIVSVDSSGVLWRYAAADTELGAGEKIGAGFSTAKSVHVLDWNADGVLDLLMQSKSGALSIFIGSPTGGFNTSQTLAPTGWSDADLTTGQWLKSGKYPSIVVQRSDGLLTSYTTKDGSSLTAATQIGYGFTRMHPVMADFDGDGNADIAVTDGAGQLVLYRSDGSGSLISENRPVIGAGWLGMSSVGPALAYTSATSQGLLARTDDGKLLYFGVSNKNLSSSVSLAADWSSFLISGSAELRKQPPVSSVSDLISIDSTGNLWNYPATGTSNLAAPARIGVGWTNAKEVHVVDWNADGIADVLTQWINGSLTIHYGSSSGGFSEGVTLATSGWTGTTLIAGHWVSGSKYPYLVGTNSSGDLYYWPNEAGKALGSPVQIGYGWGNLKVSMLDFDKDGKQDILAVDSNGYMRMYRGSGGGDFLPEDRPVIGNGWGSVNQFSGSSGYAGSGTTGLMSIIDNNQPRYYPLAAASKWGTPRNSSMRLTGVLFSK